MARFVLPGPNPGLLVPGNLDIDHRPLVRVGNSIETVHSAVWTVPTNELGRIRVPPAVKARRQVNVAVPEVYGNATHPGRPALAHALSSGQHLGIFDTVAHAVSYTQRLHREQQRFYKKQIAKILGKR